MSISWEDPTLIEGLEQLRAAEGSSALLDEIGCEYLVATFLAANDMNALQAQEALKHTAEWRKTSGAAAARERILADRSFSPQDIEHMAVISECMPLCEGGSAIDKRGISYAIRCTGLTDATTLFERITEDQMLEWQVCLTEWRLQQLEAYAHKTGRLANIMLVQDVMAPAGLLAQWRKHGHKMGIMRRVTHMLNEHYPGLVGSVMIVNAPWVIHAILQVVKPLMPEAMTKRIEVLPPHLTGARMLELVEADHLPRFLGGDADDVSFVAKRAPVEFQDGTDLTVNAGAKEERGIWLNERAVAGYGLSVQGGDRGQDIMFSCRFEAAASNDDVATDVTEVRSACRITEDSGGSSFVAPSRGRLILVFDNTFSWLNAKTIRYELVLFPTESIDEVTGQDTPQA